MTSKIKLVPLWQENREEKDNLRNLEKAEKLKRAKLFSKIILSRNRMLQSRTSNYSKNF